MCFSLLEINKMADNRLPNMAGQARMQQATAFNQMPNVGVAMGPMGQPMFAGSGQQQFAPGMQFYPGQGMNPSMMSSMPGMAPAMFPMQSMRPPARPPPPYTQQLAANYTKNRATSKGGGGGGGGPPKPKTEKERYFEEQQKKLRQFHKPGAPVADANALIENLFGKTEKPGPGHGHGHSAGVDHHGASPQTGGVSSSRQLEDDDDGFGDFLGGPASVPALNTTAATTTTTTMASTQLQPPSVASPGSEPPTDLTMPDQSSTVETRQAEEKKDLMSMMMECSDLNAPQKAKGFHKPSLIEVQKSGVPHHSKHTELHHASDHARRWDNTQDLEGLFIVERPAKPAPPPANHPPHSPTSPTFPSSHLPPQAQTEILPQAPGAAPNPQPGAASQQGTPQSAVGEGARNLPDWCHDSGKNLPVVYQHVLEAVAEGDTIVTERLYPILLMSGLPREHLGHLWSMANTHIPGQLTRSELWILLAFVALVQNKYEVTSAAILRRCPQAPVPFLGQPVTQTSGVDHGGPAAAPTPVSAGHDTHVHGIADSAVLTHASQAGVPAQAFPTSSHLHPPVGVSTTTPPVAILPTSSTEDDFADFQAAPTPAVKAPPAPAPVPAPATVTRTEDSYGEFIGGNSSSTSEQSLSSVPKEAADKLERMYSNGGLTADEQYNSNVRNFFCSSDSSTVAYSELEKNSSHDIGGITSYSSAQKTARHTTPNSMDDEDFTDGHDSMSQVSTSEQSENEDIRAFENYVEEFNRKKEAQVSDNPLSRTFPNSPRPGRVGQKAGKGAVPVKTPPALNVPIPKPPGPILPNAAARPGMKLPHHASLTGTQDDDFADFKSAVVVEADPSSEVKPVKKSESLGDMVLIGEEDKYSALRSLTSAGPSLFETSPETHVPSAGPSTEGEETDEWADFSSAVQSTPQTGVAELSVSAVQSFPSSSVVSQPSSNTPADGSDDWADFATAAPVSDPVAELSTGTDLSSMPPMARTGPMSGLSTSGEHTESVASYPDQPPSVFPSGDKPEGGDDWADFTSAGPARDTAGLTRLAGSQEGSQEGHPVISSSFSVIGTESSGGGLFSLAHTSSTTPTSSEVFTGPDQSAVLTVKKQNLATSEIMNVFKVRDDPTTLSSYELPKQPPEQHQHVQEISRRTRRSRSGSKEHQMSPDLDDDFSSGPPPLDSVGDDEDEQEYSRGYDLDDMIHQPVPSTSYSPFGFAHLSPGYARSAFTTVTKTTAGRDRPAPSAGSRSHSMSPESGETDSLSNRVSSLREDSQSVSSLDLPASKMSSTDAQRDSDNGGTDSQSVSSMEFGGLEGGLRGEGGVVESKSLDSLDLKSGGGGGEEEEEENGRWTRQGSQPPPGVMGPAPILADRYNLDGQVEGSERYAYEWERCLASSCRHISGANNVFNTISSSAVCNEVLKSPQGNDYVQGLIEVYRVVCRIMAALPSTGVNSPTIEQSLKQIDLAWNNLTAFLVGASLLPDETTFTFSQAVLKADSTAAQQKACGVCLLNVDCPQRGGTPSGGEDTPKLSYGGRQYHAPCANFWVNCVDSMLPSLKLPELL